MALFHSKTRRHMLFKKYIRSSSELLYNNSIFGNHEPAARVIYLRTTDRQTANWYSTIHALELIYFDSFKPSSHIDENDPTLSCASPRITDWHHDFLSHPHTNYGLVFLLATKYLILFWKHMKKASRKSWIRLDATYMWHGDVILTLHAQWCHGSTFFIVPTGRYGVRCVIKKFSARYAGVKFIE